MGPGDVRACGQGIVQRGIVKRAHAMGFDRGPSLGHEGVDFGLRLQDGVRGVLAEVADQLRVGGHLERARVREVFEVVRNGAWTELLLLRGVGIGEQ